MTIKATRDVYTHSNGTSNKTYQRKASSFAREELGRKLPLHDDYLLNARDKIEELINSYHSNGPSKFLSYNRVRAFEEMWTVTCLGKLVPFNDAWEITDNDMVRPKEISWAWSGGEQALYDFFRQIYNSFHTSKHGPDHNFLAYASRIWPADTPEGQVLRSWIDAQFHF